MKTRISLFSVLLIFLSMSLITCKKDKEELSAEDAKIEIRSASQTVQANMNEMMATPAMSSMIYLSELMNMEGDWKSSAINMEKYNLAVFNKIIRDNLKDDEIDPEEGGEYTFNFITEEFDLTDPSLSDLVLLFPADEEAMANEEINGSLKLEDIEFVEIEYTDEWGTYTEQVLTKVKATLKIDNLTVMTCTYNATLNSEGLPVATSITYTMDPYQLTLTQTGSGVNYTSTASLKKDGDVLLSYNLTIKYTADQDDIEKLSGNFQLTPLRFEGEINGTGMNTCSELDVDCMNDHLDVEVIQTENNSIIGHIEFRLFYDTYWEESYPEPVIVYSDGTYEWLFEALGVELEGLKAGILKR
ncbi:MAG: hypothetical protein IH597_14655 [Bacteroidales bacterium]|nr:hypothetical protein [Bacteroidales bacterium]